ncbi:desulfoferrodoxin, partial [Turicibacter sanguinis]|nr:desulfoferrodoxin [Turicibacter sanguinis]
VMRREIKATEKPEAIFPIGDFKGEVEVYAWCNLHGLWKATITL